MLFRKKPVIVEAFQFFKGRKYPECPSIKYDPLLRAEPMIDTLEGAMFISHGDWIIRGVEGEYYACKPSVFKKTYEKVDVTIPVKRKTSKTKTKAKTRRSKTKGL